MKIDLEHICRLAHLELSEEEKGYLSVQMDKILDWVGELARLETTEEGKFSPVDFCLRLEADCFEPSLPLEEVLRMAPEKEGDFIKVPKVLVGK